jgi:uncharacterized MAPEG superfamily protein
MFRRKPADLATEEPVVDEPALSTLSKSYTPKKGEATPKRVVAGRRQVEAPPTDRKEALRRSREKDRETRAQQREGMMSGDPRYLMARDRGPAKALARDIVDSRFNVGTFFIVALFVILVGSTRAMPASVQAGANLLFLFMVLAFVVDTLFLFRKIRKLVGERLPKETVRWGALYRYAIMRTLSFRRIRVPKPRVKVGDRI